MFNSWHYCENTNDSALYFRNQIQLQMKKIYLILSLILLSEVMVSQCFATMDIVTNGNEVTVTINGSGASMPGYGIIWGDGNEDQVQSATHTYTAPGTYQICYVYYDQADIINCNQTACQDVIITGEGCTMDFIPMTLGLNVGLQINSSGASAPSFTIDWGDGSPVETTELANHVYAANGTYNICVTFTDLDNPDNCTLIQCHEVVLQENTGACTVTLTTSVDGSTVLATAVGEGALSSNYIINWGDGQFDMSSSATHIYSTMGEFEVCVIYGDFGPDGCNVTDCETVLIEDLGSCTLDLMTTITGLTVVLTGTASGASSPEISVDWGDSSPTGTSIPDAHTYTTAGTYQICASYIDLDNLENCQVVSCVEVVVEEVVSLCTVELTVNQTGNVVSVTALGDGAANPQYVITWGDGSFPTLADNGSHTYTVSNTYTVCVTYADLGNPTECNATDCEDVVITVGVDENILSDNALSVYPNPMNDESTIRLVLNKPAHVQLDLFDLAGKHVSNIYNGERGIGQQNIAFDVNAVAKGVYFLRLIAGQEEKTIKVIR